MQSLGTRDLELCTDTSPQPLARKAQSMAGGYRRPGFVPPHLQGSTGSLGQSLPNDRGGRSASINIPFRPVSGAVYSSSCRKGSML
jgi:hypothetical protein